MILQIQISSITERAQRALEDLDVRLCIINSSDGAQVKESVKLSPDNSLPLKHFYGDKSQRTYDFVHAKKGMLHTLVYGALRLPGWWKETILISILGGVMGATKQHLRGEDANWQQGAAVLFDAEGKILYRHISQDPMDLGQPIEETAKVLKKPVTKDMHLDYHGATAKIANRYPVAKMINNLFPVLLFLLFVAVLTYFK